MKRQLIFLTKIFFDIYALNAERGFKLISHNYDLVFFVYVSNIFCTKVNNRNHLTFSGLHYGPQIVSAYVNIMSKKFYFHKIC